MYVYKCQISTDFKYMQFIACWLYFNNAIINKQQQIYLLDQN